VTQELLMVILTLAQASYTTMNMSSDGYTATLIAHAAEIVVVHSKVQADRLHVVVSHSE
jgi:hypothetical protein